MENRILFTGDYWHADFQGMLSSANAPVLMTPIEQLTKFEDSSDSFDLVLIAQSRRDQIEESSIEFLRTRFPSAPLVLLLGSWCEGEPRSGEPVNGVIRVYWHQWEGRYEKFQNQLRENGVTDWHQPATTSPADHIEQTRPSMNPKSSIVGVSAWTQTSYEMIADGLKSTGYRTKWLERSTWDAEAIQLLSAICVDANSVSDTLQNRLNWLATTFKDTPLVLVVNFPRASDKEEAQKMGVSQIVSKPFELNDLQAAVVRASGRAVAGDTTVIQ